MAYGYAYTYMAANYSETGLSGTISSYTNDQQTTNTGSGNHFTTTVDNYEQGNEIGSESYSQASPTSSTAGFTDTELVYSLTNNNSFAETITFTFAGLLYSEVESNVTTSSESAFSDIGFFSQKNPTNAFDVNIPLSQSIKGDQSKTYDDTPTYTWSDTIAAHSSDTITEYAYAQSSAEATPEPTTFIPLGIGVMAVGRKRILKAIAKLRKA